MNTAIACLNEAHGDNFALYHGDCVEVVKQLPPDSMDLIVYSPPFANLYVYSGLDRDMGNVESNDDFAESYAYLVRELYRVLRPGRICAVHCAELPRFKYKDGVMGFFDFPGLLVRVHEDEGFVMHAPRVTVWKDPVTEMQRSKAHRLLYLNIQRDSAKSGPGNPDYILIFRKPGENMAAVTHTPEEFPLSQWQEWASPVWMTVDQTRTLNVAGSKEDGDGRHICPLQLDVIERIVKLWSNPGEVVLSPFAGIGSEGHGALTFNRKFVGVELKDSYFQTAIRNLSEVDRPRQSKLF